MCVQTHLYSLFYFHMKSDKNNVKRARKQHGWNRKHESNVCWAKTQPKNTGEIKHKMFCFILPPFLILYRMVIKLSKSFICICPLWPFYVMHPKNTGKIHLVGTGLRSNRTLMKRSYPKSYFFKIFYLFRKFL